MGKKQKKLTDEEIEKHRNETYQMMSTISGKPISELMGESPSRPNFNENYCIIKQLYLKNCINPISSKQLYEVLQNQGYKAKYSTFRGLVNNYMKYGYIKKVNAKKPFLYVLTDEGKLHARNPFILADENIQKYRKFQLNKLKEIIESQPEVFKNLYESIHGTQNSIFSAGNVVSSGSEYSGANAGRIEEYRTKINDDGFLQNLNEDKIKELINLGDPELLTDFFINLNDYHQRHKNTMTFKQQEYNPSKPVGERKYYSLLANSINHPVTRSLYEAIPFRFIYIQKKNELRLESEVIAGRYRNNQDGTILDFDYLFKNLFKNRMFIKTQNNGKELVFFYVNENIKYQITTMSLSDYNKAKGKIDMKLKINSNIN